MSRGLINEKKAKQVRRIDKTLKVAKVVVKRVLKFTKIALIIALLYFLNQVSIKITKFIMELDFQTMRTCVFSVITIFILFNYLKTCEEIKGVE